MGDSVVGGAVRNIYSLARLPKVTHLHPLLHDEAYAAAISLRGRCLHRNLIWVKLG